MCWMNTVASGCFSGNFWFLPLCFALLLLLLIFFCFSRRWVGFHKMCCPSAPPVSPPDLIREVSNLRQEIEILRRDIATHKNEREV